MEWPNCRSIFSYVYLIHYEIALFSISRQYIF